MSEQADSLSGQAGELLSRREFLRRAGRYSAAACALFAGSSVFSACDIFLHPKNGSTFDRALDCTVDTEETMTLTAAKAVMHYRFEIVTAGAYQITITVTSESTLPVQVTLYDSAETSLGSIPFEYYDGWISGGFLASMAAGEYVVKFERNPAGDASLTFKVETDTSYSDSSWSNSYSDSSWSNSYSDTAWSNAYSDWSDYSRWADAYSDWSNIWGNWMQSW